MYLSCFIFKKFWEGYSSCKSDGKLLIKEGLVDSKSAIFNVILIFESEFTKFSINPAGSTSEEALIAFNFCEDMFNKHGFYGCFDFFSVLKTINNMTY